MTESLVAALASAYNAAGAYLGMILVVAALQVIVIRQIKSRPMRTRLTYGTIIVQVVIALLAVSVAATQDLRGCLP